MATSYVGVSHHSMCHLEVLDVCNRMAGALSGRFGQLSPGPGIKKTHRFFGIGKGRRNRSTAKHEIKAGKLLILRS